MVIQHNLMAMNAQRQYGITHNSKAKSTEKLSSGYRINRAADDAAGLAISEKMRRQIRGLTQASSNSQDGISLIQTAEGGLNEVHEMIQRLNELSVKAANGTLCTEDRQYVDQEFQNLKKEINRVAGTTTFNEIQLFPPDGSGSSMYNASFDIQMNADGTYSVKMMNDTYTVGSTSATGNATALATYIANQIPGITNDIVNAFPSLQGAPDLRIKLDLSYIDGGNGTLAYAAYSFYDHNNGTATPVTDSFLVKVDTADFTDSNALAGKDRNDLLLATLRHELTHTVMQYTLTSAMMTLPDWFTEGSAQLTGGGFSTGWLSGLESATSAADVEAYLKKPATVDSQPYGQGFLAVAYAAYLAAGSPATVNGSTLTTGLNKIFAELKNNKTLDQALQAATGKTEQQIKNAINNGEAGAADFVYKYMDASKKGDGSMGAGSALLANLNDGSAVMGAVPADGSAPTDITAADSIMLQVGSESGNQLEVNLFSIGTKSLGLYNANVLTQESASDAISSAKNALGLVSSIRSYYGATQNRLEHTIKNLDNVVENTTAAESAIRDTDMAKEMVSMSMLNILEQAGVSMMAQANQANQTVLSLLQ